MCNCRNKTQDTPPQPREVPRARGGRGVTRSVPAPAPPPAPVQQREVVTLHRRNRRRGEEPVVIRMTDMRPLEVLDTAIWGPSVWRILHTAAEQPAKAPQLAAALRALDGALPCPDCRGHYHAWLLAHPPVGDLRTWILDLHNDVNVRTGKAPWTADALAAMYGAGVDIPAALETVRGRIGLEGWRALSELV